MEGLYWAHGGPALTARLRARVEDFQVDEDLGYAADGEGGHQWLQIRKRGLNTDWLARRLAAHAGVRPVDVGYAGMKDRHAVTTQTFTVLVGPGGEPDWSQLAVDGAEVLGVARHRRKLRRGALAGNRFTIRLTEVAGDREVAERRLAEIAAHGVPNYFGEQRFGRDQANVDRALAMFAGRRVDRRTRGLLISAARSELFNRVLAARVIDGCWNQGIDGEVWCLAGSRSWFRADPDDTLQQRLEEGDVHPSGPLWGRGELPSAGRARGYEQDIADRAPALVSGLEQAGLDQDRRALRLLPGDLRWDWEPDGSLCVGFSLPAGSFATTVLRELSSWDTS